MTQIVLRQTSPTDIWYVQAIKVETAPGHVALALLFVLDVSASATDLRVGAMHRRNPLHSFMFNADGMLLNANAAALEAFEHYHTGATTVSLHCIASESTDCADMSVHQVEAD